MKTLIIFASLILFCLYAESQNEPQFTQQRGNEIMFNPGAIEQANKLNATLLARKQWFGFDGSPTSELFTVDTYVPQVKGGVGISIYNDKLGYENTLNFKAMYAHPVKISNEMSLNLGLGVGFMNKTLEGESLIYEDMTDEYAIYGNISKFRPDYSFGCELNASQGYTIGLSAIHLDKSVKGSSTLDNPRHYFLYGSHVIKLDDNINLIPYLLTKTNLRSYQFELHSVATFDRDMWWTGLAYRYQDAVAFTAGINLERTGLIEEEIKIGYSYDFGAGGIRSHTSGSHEIMLSFSMKGIDKDRIKPNSPRNFPRSAY